MTLIGLLIYLLPIIISHGDNTVSIHFQSNTNENLNDSISSSPIDNSVDIIKFYVSKLELYKDNKLVFAERNSFNRLE